MLKVCGERHQMIWYNGDENVKLDCPLCYTINLLEKANVLPIAYEKPVGKQWRGRPKKKADKDE